MKQTIFGVLALFVLSYPAYGKTQQFKSPIVVISEHGEQQYSKNASKVVPIASITKLMVAVVVLESGAPLDEVLTIEQDDVVSRSHLKVGTTLTREQMINVALMSSDNRAAHALARTLPGGVESTIAKMNEKATLLGMKETYYVEPTGLSVQNRSTALNLVKLLNYAQTIPLITKYSTMPMNEIAGRQFYSTNAYIRSGAWTDVIVSKTGFTNSAGKCIAVVLSIKEKFYDVVILGARNKKTRLKDLATARRMIYTMT